MASKKLIIDDAVPYAQALFGHLGEIECLPGRAINAECVKHADALIVRSRTQVNAALLKDSSVQFVGSTVVGLDHIDQAWLAQQGIRFYSAQGCNANSVAEYVIAALLDLAEHQKFDLQRKTLGIIGVGHVGRLLAEKAQSLGLRCLLNDPPRAAIEGEQGFSSLEELLTQADIITVHTPLTQDGNYPTRHLLNADNLALLRPNTLLINAARGGIIDEQAWLTTQTQANIIDCWQNEPFINPALYQRADIATPHIAGHSLEAKINGSVMVYRQLCQYWQIEPEHHWRSQLPPSPAPLIVPQLAGLQTMLAQIIKQTYDIRQDDSALRHPDISQVQHAFEDYRRHYPIRREWAQHRLTPTPHAQLNDYLKRLGFMLN
jgi:erythronate-4-phosphate dehydrogenase